MKNDLFLLAIISFLLLVTVFFIMRKKYKGFKKMTNEERKKEVDKNLDRTGWLVIVKNILKLFTNW